MLGDGSLAALLGADVIAPYRTVYGRVAASCAVLGEALAASTEKRLHSCGKAVVGSLTLMDDASTWLGHKKTCIAWVLCVGRSRAERCRSMGSTQS